MLNFIDVKMSDDELKAVCDAAKDDKELGLTPLEALQERVMENVLTHVARHFVACGEFIANLPIEWSMKPEDTLANITAQLVERAQEDGLLIDAGDDNDDYIDTIPFIC